MIPDERIEEIKAICITASVVASGLKDFWMKNELVSYRPPTVTDILLAQLLIELRRE